MKEWSNPWNPFNSAKVLLWKEHLEACAKEDYLPPVTVDLDPSNKCMFDCPHCNAYDMMNHSNKLMSGDHMLKLVDFLVLEVFHLVLVGGAAFQPGDGSVARQYQVKFCMLRHGALHEQD